MLPTSTPFYLSAFPLQCRARIENLNWERQQEQQEVGKDLYALELRWGELISKNFELEVSWLGKIFCFLGLGLVPSHFGGAAGPFTFLAGLQAA